MAALSALLRSHHHLSKQRIVYPRTIVCSRHALRTNYAPLFRTYATEPGKGENDPPKQVSPEHAPDSHPVVRNPFGVQLLNSRVHTQLFHSEYPPKDPDHTEIALQHLKDQELDPQDSDPLPSVNFDLPPLVGKTIQEHFWHLGKDQSEPYHDIAKNLADTILPPIETVTMLPPRPTNWDKTPGWTRYDTKNNETTKVPYPLEDAIVFDTEVLYKVTGYPALATAVSKDAWYGWVSPDIVTGDSTFPSKALIPLGPTAVGSNANERSGARVVVGHSVGYDRARVAEEYNLKAPERAYLDTMSLHIAIAGLSNQQRPRWMQYNKGYLPKDEDKLFCQNGTMNGLDDLAKFYCHETLPKEDRKMFGKTSIDDICDNFERLMNYCANDVQITARIYPIVLRKFLEKCPHPVSFAGMIHMGQSILPVNRSWKRYIDKSEAIYQDDMQKLGDKLNKLAEEALELTEEEWKKDVWLRHLDWSVTPLRQTKKVLGKDGKLKEPSILQKKQRPAWYKNLLTGKEKQLKIGFKTQAAPYLLRLKWHGFPLYFNKDEKWCYRVGPEDFSKPIPANAIPVNFVHELENKQNTDRPTEQLDFYFPIYLYDDEPVARVVNKTVDKYAARDIAENRAQYFRMPHREGEKKHVGSPLTTYFNQFFADGILTSDHPFAKEILDANESLTYWSSARGRIREQFVVWGKDKNIDNSDSVRESPSEVGKNLSGDPNVNSYLAERKEDEKELGIILPQMITMGTITRRAVEKTWLTASNPTEKRVGSELKAMICAPPGFKIVGADVDAEELWIIGLMGDAQFKSHGSTALGWMTLKGTKSAGTDMHSRSAKFLGSTIDRSKAKVFNYSRMYGATIDFASNQMQQLGYSKEVADTTAKTLFEKTKGTRGDCQTPLVLPYWFGGSESYSFTSIQYVANYNPRTPVLNCEITNTLLPKVTLKFYNSRHNWVVQSSGVDFLHMLLVSVNHLARRHGINAKYMISLHDEIRYLVAEEDADRAALALQIANLWTRSMFSARLGIENLPESVAYFSAVDIDHVLRKEVELPCKTRSQPYSIPPGAKYEIFETLKRTNNGNLGPVVRNDPTPTTLLEVPRSLSGISESVLQPFELYLQAQACRTNEDIGYQVAEAIPQTRSTGLSLQEKDEKLAKWSEGHFTDDPILTDMIDESEVPDLDMRYEITKKLTKAERRAAGGLR